MITDDNPAATDVDRAADQVRKDVLSRARHAVARLELQRPTLIEIAWKGSGRPVQPSRDVLGVAPEELMGTVTQVSETCRQLPLHQLVVLGAPGTGKSVVAIQLVHEMTKEPQPGDPVPVLMSLSSWRPAISMREWILRQIRQSSPSLASRWRFGVDAAPGLFDAGMVMPVLDGLDELPEPLRARAIEAIDKVIPDGCWLLVTCRGDEYETACGAGPHLTRAAVVELEAVEAKAAITYLTRSKLSGDDRWNVVFDAMRGESESTLARTMASPLMLYLAKTTYRARLTEPGELVSQMHSKEDVEDTLLNRYLPAVYTEDPPTRYKEALAKRYLTLMARQMRRDGTVDFAWWQIDARLTGPLVGLAFGSVWGWFLHVLFGPVWGVATGCLVGLGGYLAHAAVRNDLKQVYVPKAAEHGPKALLHRYALIAVASALAIGGITGACAAWWLVRELRAEGQTAWYYGTIVGAASGVATLLGSAWGSYQLSRSWFWLTRRLPWRLAPFLDDARELGVLRQIGPVHQFRHERVLRQLDGGIAEKPPRSVHGKWNAKWRRWRPLLPVFASLSQVGFAMLGLMTVAAMYVSSTKIELRYQSGDKPRYSVDTSVCANQIAYSCTGVATWSWKLSQGSSRRTVWLPATLHGRSILGWDGRIKADGCARGAVEVTLALAGKAPVAFILSDSADVRMKDLTEPPPGAPTGLPHPAETGTEDRSPSGTSGEVTGATCLPRTRGTVTAGNSYPFRWVETRLQGVCGALYAAGRAALPAARTRAASWRSIDASNPSFVQKDFAVTVPAPCRGRAVRAGDHPRLDAVRRLGHTDRGRRAAVPEQARDRTLRRERCRPRDDPGSDHRFTRGHERAADHRHLHRSPSERVRVRHDHLPDGQRLVPRSRTDAGLSRHPAEPAVASAPARFLGLRRHQRRHLHAGRRSRVARSADQRRRHPADLVQLHRRQPDLREGKRHARRGRALDGRRWRHGRPPG
ncbi:NACHT domain-containing protein [Streptomyces melanosporofaciens]|uniref:NACHT domain-containing protein n=1 Tax=Streptomyces melanosporofaciens TaxID=67327 RepID=UPI00115FB101|nr:NACHT domain-containing protein [Streptomyces melanosporofaciens]